MNDAQTVRTSKTSQQADQFDPARLITEHQTGIWRYLRALGCEASLADDLTQDTFLAVIKRPFEDYNPAATASYLRRVARNLFISHQRRMGRVTVTAEMDAFDLAWDRWAGNDEGDAVIDALNECLTHLTDRARFALARRFRDRASRAEIAEALNISEHGAKNLMQRAKAKLRECVEGKLE